MTDDEKEAFEERLAIMQFDGGLSIEEATKEISNLGDSYKLYELDVAEKYLTEMREKLK